MSLNLDSTKVEILRLVNENMSLRNIEKVVGVSRSAISKFLRKETHKDWWALNDKPIASGSYLDHHTNIKKLDKKRYIVTSAQNNTFVHPGFLAALERMADDIDAQIIVGTYSYNTSGFQNLQKGEGEWFDPKIKDYILDEPVQLAEGLMWLGELNILPTAVNPLSGLQSYSMGSSAIVPHAKVQLESLPTHKTDPVRMMYTTGSVTKRNYIQKKAGQKASFHHVFGALLVEIDDEGDWFVRQLIADSKTGNFQDLDTLYTSELKVNNAQVEAINWGDIHVEKLDPSVANASFFGNNNMLDALRPNYQFVHDGIDFESRNHHNIKDPYFRFKMHKNGKDNVRKNIEQFAQFLKQIDRTNTHTVVVESNHDLALKRWLKEADYKTDPENAIFFLECQLMLYKLIERGDDNGSLLGDVLYKVLNNDFHSNATFLTQDDSFKICDGSGNGIECGAHGHLGNNGSKGSILSYKQLGTRYNIGHSHAAGIKDGVYQAGVSATLDMGYNQGGSSWSHSHIVTYPNGKRTIITIKNGKWRA
jgi:hypothetical protein